MAMQVNATMTVLLSSHASIRSEFAAIPVHFVPFLVICGATAATNFLAN
jgi:hypothetical protein